MIFQSHAELTDVTGTDHFPSRTCNHCNGVTVAKAQQHFRNREDMGDLGQHCKGCGEWICDRCASLGGCDPWEHQMRRMERRR